MIRSNLRATAALLIVFSVLAAGCQWLGQNLTDNDRLAEKRRQRADAFARSIDQQHEQADLIAARDLWQRGDRESCKRRLNEVLTRNPEQLDARLLLAEVYLDENQPQEGIRVLKPAETAHHDDARVQYTMGLLLDASGSQEGARTHYQAAARLEPSNEVYTVSYNEAITSAKGTAALRKGETSDLNQSDPSLAPPPPDDPQSEPGRVGPDVRAIPRSVAPGSGVTPGVAAGAKTPNAAVVTADANTRGSTVSPGGYAGPAYANVDATGVQPVPAPTPQDFQLPVILRGAAPLPAAGNERPGPQVVRQDFSSVPQTDSLPPVSVPEPTTFSASASPSAIGATDAPNTPPLPSFFPESNNDAMPQIPQQDNALVAVVARTSSASDPVARPELPVPMVLSLPSASTATEKSPEPAEPRKELPTLHLTEPAAASSEHSILASSPVAAKPAAPTASQPSRLPQETAAAKKLQPDDESPSLRFVVPAENSGAIEVSDGLAEAAGVDRTAHTEPIDPFGGADGTVGPARSAATGMRGHTDAATTRSAVAAVSGNDARSPSPSDVATPRLASTAGQASSDTPLNDSVGGAAAEDLLRQGAEALSAGKTDVAMAFFREAAASHPHDPQIPISAAVAALRQNHPEVAVELLDVAASRFPKSAAVYRVLGAACYRRTDYRAAQSALKQALLLDKGNPLSYFLMGCTLVKLGEQSAAEEFFRQARLLDPKYAVPRP